MHDLGAPAIRRLAAGLALLSVPLATMAWAGPAAQAAAPRAASAAATCSAPQFAPHVDFPVGDGPWAVAVGDFNRDGNPDVAVANSYAYTVSVLLGLGGSGFAPQFAPQVDLPVAASPNSVAVADFDRDGNPDLATGNFAGQFDPGTVSVLLGDGHGGFAPQADFPAGVGTGAVVVGDFDRDGMPDLAVGNYYANDVSVLLGDGHGGFAPHADFGVPGHPNDVVVGDFNRDGTPDLAVAIDYGGVSVLLGDGAGGFAPHADFAHDLAAQSLAAGDFDGDAKPDLAAANYDRQAVSILPGDGAGGFGPHADFVVGGSPWSVAVGDFNRDGRLDVATANYFGIGVSVLLGDGHGHFGPHADFPVGTGVFSLAVAVGDFNRDGLPDLVNVNAADSVSVLPNECGLILRVAPSSPVHAGQRVAVGWANIPVPSARDWLGLYRAGAPDTAALNRVYVSCSQVPAAARPSGFCTGPLPPGLAAGDYEVRLFSDGGYTRLATAPLTVSAGAAAAPALPAPSTARGPAGGDGRPLDWRPG